jgi:hypothetical protein
MQLAHAVETFCIGLPMSDSILVLQKEIDVSGAVYSVSVYCRADGRHFAQTRFADEDIIISDGETPEEALSRHEKLVPLAVQSRRVLRDSSWRFSRFIPRS